MFEHQRSEDSFRAPTVTVTDPLFSPHGKLEEMMVSERHKNNPCKGNGDILTAYIIVGYTEEMKEVAGKKK
jgi:hypothetical protein